MFADQGYTSALFDAVLRHQGGKLPTLTPVVPNATRGGGVPPQQRMMYTTSNWFLNGSENIQYEYSNDELLLLDRMNGVSFDNEHEYQMSLLKSLKDRRLPHKKRRVEMRSECEDFMAQTFGLNENASKNMSRLMYDPKYEFP